MKYSSKGFKRYGSLESCEIVDIPAPQVEVIDVKSRTDELFDRIFSKDKNGWPQSSIACMLSEKTSEDIRKFIQDNLYGNISDSHLINNPELVSEFDKIDSEFVARCSRNRFESIEDYESRLQSIIKDDDTADLIRTFHEKLNSVAK